MLTEVLIAWFQVQFGINPNCMIGIDIINLAKLTVPYNKYEHVWDRKVYGMQVYSTLYSLQQIVVAYKLRVIR